MFQITKIKSMFKNNGKVVENYFFMTALQVISSAFGILIYPFLIRVLGSESYGTYVFALAIITYFISVISFGFNLPGLKIISQNLNNRELKSEALSSILSAKFYISCLCTLVFFILLQFIPYLHANKFILFIVYSQIIAEIILPVWYFQGIQKMKIVTYYQLFFRIVSLPFIFIFIKSGNDLFIYAIIATLSVILPAIGLFLYIIYIDKISIKLIPIHEIKKYITDALPFFWSNAAGTLKQESVTVIIGAFFGMRDVAFYDLANKLIIMPRMLTTSINAAIFPRIINDLKSITIKKIIRYEWIIGLTVIAFVTVFGYWIILFLGGKEMITSYPLAIILSFTVLVWLVVGSYINFIFVPQNRYYYITVNQLVALMSFLIAVIPLIFFTNNIFVIVGALSFSGFCEIIYCKYMIRKHSML